MTPAFSDNVMVYWGMGTALLVLDLWNYSMNTQSLPDVDI